MTLDQFLTAVQTVASRELTYKPGHSGDDGFCDCIGLIIGAVKLCGIAWKGIHGSNWAARNEVTDLHAVSKATDLKPGDIVFKAYEPGASGWDLPERYKNDPDQRDYYHVGVVTQLNPLRITHMTTPTVKVDTKIGKWSFAGTLKYICASSEAPSLRELAPEATEGVETMTAVICSDDGNPVKLRPTPSTEKPYLDKLPVGSIVTVIEKGEEWSKVTAGSNTGYIMTRFLQFTEEVGELITLTIPAEFAVWLRNELNKAL